MTKLRILLIFIILLYIFKMLVWPIYIILFSKKSLIYSSTLSSRTEISFLIMKVINIYAYCQWKHAIFGNAYIISQSHEGKVCLQRRIISWVSLMEF